MEKPFRGRAIIRDNITNLQIIIPARRHWFLTIFIGVWLCGWFIGETSALGIVIGIFTKSPASLFVLFWLMLWTVGGFAALRVFLWNLRGKEVITIGQGQLRLERKGLLLSKPKTYDLNEVRNIRVQDNGLRSNTFFESRRSDLGMDSSGLIRFDYGLKTVQFASAVDEAEARFLLEKLKDRRVLTEKNWS